MEVRYFFLSMNSKAVAVQYQTQDASRRQTITSWLCRNLVCSVVLLVHIVVLEGVLSHQEPSCLSSVADATNQILGKKKKKNAV